MIVNIFYNLSAQWLGFLIAVKLLAPSKKPSTELVLLKIITDRKLGKDLVQDAITQAALIPSLPKNILSLLYHASIIEMKEIAFSDTN